MPASTHHRLAASLAVAAVLVGCSGGEPAATPSSPDKPTATVSVEETPTYELRPVVGERILGVFDLSSAEILGAGGRQGVDEARANAAMERVGDLLDAHLDDLQRGGKGALGEVIPERPEASGDLTAITRGLATTDRPVDAARYMISAYGDGGPQWVSAQVEVTHPDGAMSASTLVFALGAEDALQLVLAGPEDTPEPEAATEAEEPAASDTEAEG